MILLSFTNLESFSCIQWYLYSSVRKFIIEGTDENGENWYMTNNNQFTVWAFENTHMHITICFIFIDINCPNYWQNISIAYNLIMQKLKRCVWETGMPPVGTKSKLAIFSIKIMVKVTRSLILVTFKRVSLVEYACQIQSIYLLWFKSYGQGWSFLPQTHTQTDRTNTRCPRISFWGHENRILLSFERFISEHHTYLLELLLATHSGNQIPPPSQSFSLSPQEVLPYWACVVIFIQRQCKPLKTKNFVGRREGV